MRSRLEAAMLDFSHVNLLAVMLAAAASFIFGGLWYGLFSQQWMQAAGITLEQIKSSKGPVLAPYIKAYLAELVMAFVLASVIWHLAGSDVSTIGTGMMTGALIWVGFVMSSLVVNHGFQGANSSLTLIDGGHWLGVLLTQGAVLGWLGMN